MAEMAAQQASGLEYVPEFEELKSYGLQMDRFLVKQARPGWDLEVVVTQDDINDPLEYADCYDPEAAEDQETALRALDAWIRDDWTFVVLEVTPIKADTGERFSNAFDVMGGVEYGRFPVSPTETEDLTAHGHLWENSVDDMAGEAVAMAQEEVNRRHRGYLVQVWESGTRRWRLWSGSCTAG